MEIKRQIIMRTAIFLGLITLGRHIDADAKVDVDGLAVIGVVFFLWDLLEFYFKYLRNEDYDNTKS